MDPDHVEISAGNGAAKLTLTTAGDVTVEAMNIRWNATATLEAKGNIVNVNGDANATFKGGGLCTVQGGLVKIN